MVHLLGCSDLVVAVLMLTGHNLCCVLIFQQPESNIQSYCSQDKCVGEHCSHLFGVSQSFVKMSVCSRVGPLNVLGNLLLMFRLSTAVLCGAVLGCAELRPIAAITLYSGCCWTSKSQALHCVFGHSPGAAMTHAFLTVLISSLSCEHEDPQCVDQT